MKTKSTIRFTIIFTLALGHQAVLFAQTVTGVNGLNSGQGEGGGDGIAYFNSALNATVNIASPLIGIGGNGGDSSTNQSTGQGGEGIGFENSDLSGAGLNLSNSSLIKGVGGNGGHGSSFDPLGLAPIDGTPGQGIGVVAFRDGTFSTLSNSSVGSIVGQGGNSNVNGGTGTGVEVDQTSVGILSNAGSISGLGGSSGSGSGGSGIGIVNLGDISILNNFGSIYGLGHPGNSSLGSDGGGVGIYNLSTIGTLTNTGAIFGLGGQGSYGIINLATINTINNLQGAGNNLQIGGGALTYSGVLPNHYNIIINSPTYFGQLAATGPTGPTGSMAFGIYSGGVTDVAASSVAIGTYADVLQGFVGTLSGNTISGSGYSITGTSGSYGGFNYSLSADTLHAGMWNLVFVAGSSNITLAGSPYYTANLGTTVNPVFDGGTLKVSTASPPISQAFTITANNGTIDQNSVASNFTGNITNSGAGVNGKLTIINSGTGGSVALSGTNTYSGGTEVQAGANLSISSPNNIGSGTLALVGSSTTNATLTTTASMILNNSITVSGDPVFNVASGTTTTISSPITNGVTAGDVVVEGGGTLALTAANTYTGLTNIAAGSTLALSDAGSITASSSVTNNGTFNIAGKTSNVSVASYTQGATGTLAMGIAPSNTPKLNVAGVASLAGGLSLAASSGSYAPGKYTLLTANGGVTGSFGNLTTNLSSYTTLGYGLTYDANDVYLVFTPNVADTQQSLVNTSQALQNTYTLQNSVLANSFSYDCNEFGINNICISAGGRNTAVSAANGLNNTSALLIAAYRPHPNYRIGAYADQNLSMNNGGSTVNLGNNTPLIGLFGAWNQNLDGTGTEIKVSAAYGQKNATVTRQVVGTSEAGSGGSQLNSQGAQITAKYGFAVLPQVIVSPYIGMRYTQNNMNGYTEDTSATVTAPLTYAALNTNATTALAGVGASYRFIPQATAFASAGVETDTNTSNGTYSATGVSGLTPINFNANPVKTRPTAMLGAYYDVMKNQRLGITGIYRQEPYQGVSTTTVMATYTIGM